MLDKDVEMGVGGAAGGGVGGGDVEGVLVCSCEGAYACGREVERGVDADDVDGEGSDESSDMSEKDGDSDEEMVLDTKVFHQTIPESMGAETLAEITENGDVIGGRRVDPKSLP